MTLNIYAPSIHAPSGWDTVLHLKPLAPGGGKIETGEAAGNTGGKVSFGVMVNDSWQGSCADEKYPLHVGSYPFLSTDFFAEAEPGSEGDPRWSYTVQVKEWGFQVWHATYAGSGLVGVARDLSDNSKFTLQHLADVPWCAGSGIIEIEEVGASLSRLRGSADWMLQLDDHPHQIGGHIGAWTLRHFAASAQDTESDDSAASVSASALDTAGYTYSRTHASAHSAHAAQSAVRLSSRPLPGTGSSAASKTKTKSDEL
jgi:hypothetical protein